MTAQEELDALKSIPNPQEILDALLAYGDHLPNCDRWPDCTCGYVLAISTARGDFVKPGGDS